MFTINSKDKEYLKSYINKVGLNSLLFRSRSGKSVLLDITREFQGYSFLDRVSTPCGRGTVIGLKENKDLYILLDKDKGISYWDNFLELVQNGKFEKLDESSSEYFLLRPSVVEALTENEIIQEKIKNSERYYSEAMRSKDSTAAANALELLIELASFHYESKVRLTMLYYNNLIAKSDIRSGIPFLYSPAFAGEGYLFKPLNLLSTEWDPVEFKDSLVVLIYRYLHHEIDKYTIEKPSLTSQWFQEAANDQDNPYNEFALGILHFYGIDHIADKKEGLRLFISSAEKGCSPALQAVKDHNPLLAAMIAYKLNKGTNQEEFYRKKIISKIKYKARKVATVFHAIAAEGLTDVIVLFSNDPDFENNLNLIHNGKSSISIAIDNQNDQLVKEFISYGANLNQGFISKETIYDRIRSNPALIESNKYLDEIQKVLKYAVNNTDTVKGLETLKRYWQRNKYLFQLPFPDKNIVFIHYLATKAPTLFSDFITSINDVDERYRLLNISNADGLTAYNLAVLNHAKLQEEYILRLKGNPVVALNENPEFLLILAKHLQKEQAIDKAIFLLQSALEASTQHANKMLREINYLKESKNIIEANEIASDRDKFLQNVLSKIIEELSNIQYRNHYDEEDKEEAAEILKLYYKKNTLNTITQFYKIITSSTRNDGEALDAFNKLKDIDLLQAKRLLAKIYATGKAPVKLDLAKQRQKAKEIYNSPAFIGDHTCQLQLALLEISDLKQNCESIESKQDSIFSIFRNKNSSRHELGRAVYSYKIKVIETLQLALQMVLKKQDTSAYLAAEEFINSMTNHVDKQVQCQALVYSSFYKNDVTCLIQAKSLDMSVFNSAMKYISDSIDRVKLTQTINCNIDYKVADSLSFPSVPPMELEALTIPPSAPPFEPEAFNMDNAEPIETSVSTMTKVLTILEEFSLSKPLPTIENQNLIDFTEVQQVVTTRTTDKASQEINMGYCKLWEGEDLIVPPTPTTTPNTTIESLAKAVAAWGLDYKERSIEGALAHEITQPVAANNIGSIFKNLEALKVCSDPLPKESSKQEYALKS